MANYSIDFINKAKELYLQGFSQRKIAQQMGIKSYITVFRWAQKYQWKKDSPKYPTASLKEQLEQCTDIVNEIRPKLKGLNVLTPTKEERELLQTYNRFSNLQIKLVRQLTSLKVVEKKPLKANIFLD